jgi:hypothetical protein
MSAEFLVLANLLLLGRLACLFKDDAVPGRIWLAKALAELAGLAILYPWSSATAAAAVFLAALNVAGWRAERGIRRRSLSRLLLGVVLLAGLSWLFVPARGIGFRPGFARIALRLPEWTAAAPLLLAAVAPPAQLFLLGLLLVANEANLAIRAVFDWLDLKPRSARADGGMVDVGEFNRGRVIGVLERILLYVFLLEGQFGAIGFVLAAKAFTRFKALDDRSFAEYVLIGTLLSACCALGIASAVKAL